LNTFENIIHSCDGKAELPHDPSEIILMCWFAAQESFLIIIRVENSENRPKKECTLCL